MTIVVIVGYHFCDDTNSPGYTFVFGIFEPGIQLTVYVRIKVTLFLFIPLHAVPKVLQAAPSLASPSDKPHFRKARTNFKGGAKRKVRSNRRELSYSL